MVVQQPMCLIRLLHFKSSAIIPRGGTVMVAPRCLPPRSPTPDGVKDWKVQSYSTTINTQFPWSRIKGHLKKKATVRVIKVGDESVSEGRAGVTHVNQHSFNQTLGGHPELSATEKLSKSEESFLARNLIVLNEQISNEKFKDLLKSCFESSWTNCPNISEEVRWDRSMTHTYDPSFMFSDVSNNMQKLEQKPSVKNFAEDLFKSDIAMEEELPLNFANSDTTCLSSPLSGFSHVETASLPEISDHEPHNVAQKLEPKKVSHTNVKNKKNVPKKNKKSASVPQNTQSMPVKLEEVNVAASSTKKSKRKRSSTNLSDKHMYLEDEILNVEEDLLPDLEEKSVEAPSTLAGKSVKEYKKVKLMEEKNKHLKEMRRRGREESFNQSLAAYLCMCVNLGMLNRATHTLLYYRQCFKHSAAKFFSQKITSVHPYNIVLLGHAEKQNLKKMEELLKCLKEDNILPNEATYAALLNCLGRLPESPANTSDINTYLSAVKEAGIDINSLFNKVNFVRKGYENALRAVRRVLPSFEPQPETISFGYNCSLVDSLNNSLYSTQIASPADGVVTEAELIKWAEEQFAMEMKSEVVINSIVNAEKSKDTQYYRKMLEMWEERWRTVLRHTFTTQVSVLKKSFFSNQLDKRMTLYPYLISLPPEEFVNIMMQEVQRLAGGSVSFSLPKFILYRQLGELVFKRYLVQYKKKVGVLDILRSVYKDYLSWYLDSNKKDGVTYIPRIRWQELNSKKYSGLSLEHGPVEWPVPVQVALGKFMYSMILLKVTVWSPLHSEKNAYPAVYEVERMKGYRTVDNIKPSPALVELFQKAAKSTLTFESMVSPMLCPPLPWVSTQLGGYLLINAKIVRLPYNAHQQKQRMAECGNQQLYPVMDSLNQLSTIPWKINKPILDIIIKLFNDKGCEKLNIPQPPSQCPEPGKIHPGMKSSEAHKTYRQCLEYDKKKNEMYSLWCDALYKLSLANHLRDRVFWFPHNMDFRGRVYPCPPYLNHLSSDVFRSILQFARGEKLGPNGLKWLKLHLINLTGFVKRKALSDRLKYCDEVMEDILDSADKPMTGKRWWVKSEEPWQTLAACKELAAALRCGDPSNYVCHLPIHQDGSCNGLQHYAALGRDKSGAISVNLAPSEVPQDVYSAIAALVEKEREMDAAAGHKIAQVLEGHVKRKVIKQTVMTTVYGVTRYGARLQIERQLKDLDDFPPEHQWAASQYLVFKTFLCLEKMFIAIKEIQNWFTGCAKIVSECGENVEYLTRLGLPVVQPYNEFIGDRASVTKLPVSFTMDSYMKPNKRKQKNAFPPNFIHSLDSSHMMLTSLFCQQAGITFVSVHDCFWTHASSVDIMSKICREQFIALHQQPILEDLSKFIQKTFRLSESDIGHENAALDSRKKRIINFVSKIPPKGDFDINSVHDSLYFFS
ncbi:hypothetical protein OTU49_012002 [Cherax quadricarinatus]|uniref:DNA-directed RNA polymerase n=1 Tax=Cherax quadricarinatus TaxID=27406 RepID=A0AAW0W166_CHEQU